MTSYSTYEKELHAAAARRDFERRSSGAAGDYYRERERDNPHTDVSLDRCPSGGGEAARWATSEKVPEWVNFDDHIFAPDLKAIAERCGANVAASVDALCRPCEVCGLNTYGGGVCSQCEGGETIRSNRGPVVTAELAGAFTPRCDF